MGGAPRAFRTTTWGRTGAGSMIVDLTRVVPSVAIQADGILADAILVGAIPGAAILPVLGLAAATPSVAVRFAVVLPVVIPEVAGLPVAELVNRRGPRAASRDRGAACRQTGGASRRVES